MSRVKYTWVKISNDKILMKKMQGLNKDIPCSWIGRLSMVKISFLPNLIFRFSVIPI